LAPHPGHRLAGKEVAASWDAALAPAMLDQRVSIAEEAVAAMLLGDLGCR
jgi:hypothetical protein